MCKVQGHFGELMGAVAKGEGDVYRIVHRPLKWAFFDVY